MSYAELSAKSCFSFLIGASHPEEMVEQAKNLGYQALGLTDKNGFYGMVRGFSAAEKLGLNFLVGTEIEVDSFSLAFLAKDFTGYQQLCRLLSEGFKIGGKIPKFNLSLIETYLSPHLYTLILPRQFPPLAWIQKMRERTSFIQLVTKTMSPHRDRPLKSWLKELPKDFTRAWTWDPLMHLRERHELLEVLQAIRTNTPLHKCLSLTNGEDFLKPLSALEKFCVPKAWISKTLEIAESCSFSPRQIRYQYPREWLPPGRSSLEFLKELCEKGLEIRYPNSLPTDVQKQLKHELQLVEELQYEDYFLTIWDIVHFARSQKILCQGRGSAANSVICYLLEITSIDPVRMNLLFERFISKERSEAPDIDVDFEHERREEVIQYVYKKYGRDRAGMVATLITYRSRSALRDVGKALGISLEKIEAHSHRVSWKENVFLKTPTDPLEARWLRIAKELKTFPRHIGQHTGGMILSGERLDEISPIQPATMEGRTTVQWDKYDIEKLGLLKIDLLSLGMLTCLRKTFELVCKHFQIDLELHTIPPDDEKTYAMIGRAQTVGVFQIESRAQMSMLPRLRPKNFYDLVIEVGIVRPGPIQGGMIHPFLKRRLGLEKITYAHPKLKPILEKTLGIPLFQEQVMKMAIDVAGYAPGEADALRRAMGTWKKSGDLEEHAKDMKTRLIKNGVGEEFSQKVCDQILGFGEYGFPESHAASFALLTYASAYLKAHYPEAFLCSLLNSMPMGFYPFHMLLSAFQREGVKILPVHTEYSNLDHELIQISGERPALHLGFRCVRHLERAHIEEFCKKRAQGELDLYIFNQRERASLAMISEIQKRRENYWKWLAEKPESLGLSSRVEPSFPKIHPMESMFLDFKFMEGTLSTHPALLAKKFKWSYALPKERLTLSEELLQKPSSAFVFVFGMVQVVQSPPTAHGMFFMTLEDETGFLNLVLTPPIYQRYKNLIQSEWVLLVSGKLQNEAGSLSILVKQVFAPQVRASIYPLSNNESLLYEKRMWGA